MMQTSTKKTIFFLVILTIAAVFAAILSVFLGSTDISWQTVLEALFQPGSDQSPANRRRGTAPAANDPATFLSGPVWPVPARSCRA